MDYIKGNDKELRILTWHVHGSYLYYLTQTPCQFFLPIKEGKPEGYGGRSGAFHWGDNVHEVAAHRVKDMEFDCILFQSKKNYQEDQYDILSKEQRELPRIYLEHDPPREVPTDTHHIVDDPAILITHVTYFNDLMWNNNHSPTKVIEHGVTIPKGIKYSGELDKGIVVINGIAKRGRRLGLDIFEKVREEIPLDIIGMGSQEVGGLGEVPPPDLPDFISRYRFFFNPIRYTSMGLAVCEAMMIGLPIIGLATTEMAVNVINGTSGYVHTNIDFLVERMKFLLENKAKANQLGMGAQTAAKKTFNIDRFTKDWMETFEAVVYQSNFNQIQIGGVQ